MSQIKLQKLLRVCRVANTALHVSDEYSKLTSMLKDSTDQSVCIIETKGLISRIQTKTVRPEDVRRGGRVVVNSLPRVYQVVERHIRKRVTDAKT